jgi:hypothetical protein
VQRVEYRFGGLENLTNLSDKTQDGLAGKLGSLGHCADIMNADFNKWGQGTQLTVPTCPE